MNTNKQNFTDEHGENKGSLLRTASVKNYMIEKIVGILIIGLIIVVYIFVIYTSLIIKDFQLLPSIIIILISLLLWIRFLPLFLSRRVYIYERGIIPAKKFIENIFRDEEFLYYSEIEDMKMMGDELAIRTKNGHRYSISKINVGKKMFEDLREIKDKFYWMSSYDKTVDKIFLDGVNPWEKFGYPSKKNHLQ